MEPRGEFFGTCVVKSDTSVTTISALEELRLDYRRRKASPAAERSSFVLSVWRLRRNTNAHAPDCFAPARAGRRTLIALPGRNRKTPSLRWDFQARSPIARDTSRRSSRRRRSPIRAVDRQIMTKMGSFRHPPKSYRPSRTGTIPRRARHAAPLPSPRPFQPFANHSISRVTVSESDSEQTSSSSNAGFRVPFQVVNRPRILDFQFQSLRAIVPLELQITLAHWHDFRHGDE